MVTVYRSPLVLFLGTLNDFLMHAAVGLGVDPDRPSPSRSFKQVSSDTIPLLLGTLNDFLMHAAFGLGVDPDQPDVFAFMIVQTSL